MADSFPKPIMPYLEGKIGELRKMRFWSKVDIGAPEDCWEWQASLTTSGYGRFKIASHVQMSANRVALVIHTGEDHQDLFACHTCDNPKCCNPHHLYWGTHSDNMRDVIDRNRRAYRDQSGTANGAAKIDDRQLALIVERIGNGWTNKRIAEDLPISHGTVSLIRLGKMWRKQTEALGYEPKAQFKRKAA